MIRLPQHMMKQRLLSLSGSICCCLWSTGAVANTMLSNLGATWPNQGIGDIGLVFSGQSFGMSFQTGNTPYGIDSITLEHFEYSALAAQDFDLQIFRIGNKLPGPNPNVWSVSLLGEL